MFTFTNLLAVIATFGLSTAALADMISTRNGEDTFFAGSQISQAVDTVGDTFMAARSVKVNGTAQGDLHVSGLDVSVRADVVEDLYALGGDRYYPRCHCRGSGRSGVFPAHRKQLNHARQCTFDGQFGHG